MKKSMLCAGLMTILCATAFAEDSDNQMNLAMRAMQEAPANVASQEEIGTSMVPHQDAQRLASVQTPGIQGIPTPSSQSTGTKTPADQGVKTPTTPNNPTVPSGQAPTGSGATITPNPGIPKTATSTSVAQPLDCNYRIPAETTRIEQTIVMRWAEKAAEQSFNFDHNVIDKQLAALKACYTEQGWEGFNDALQKSGNLNAIKSQELAVSSMINGEAKVLEIKDNQWKVTLPMQVVYQNNKEKLTQPLVVSLVVGRKTSGDLGIMQMIAIPHQATAPNATTPATTTTPVTQ